MGVPQVVIVGRPNVGKSSLFNWLAGKRIAIVDPTAGVTRDRVTHLLALGDRFVELVDTGGMGIVDSDNLTEQIEDQIQTAIDSADVILFVVDTRDGHDAAGPGGGQAAALRRRAGDLRGQQGRPRRAGLAGRRILPIRPQGDPRQRAGEPRQGRAGEAIAGEAAADRPTKKPPDEAVMKVAIVGRRNMGKSTLVNTLAQAERMIISEVPGTTRDSVDVRFEMDGKVFMAIDTPGFRRSKSVATDIDFYSTHRAQRSIRRADVVLLFFDASQRISKVDKQLCDYIAQQYKPCIFVVNKWDLHGRQHAHGKMGQPTCATLSARCFTRRSPSSPGRRARTSRRCSTTRRCFSSSRGRGSARRS